MAEWILSIKTYNGYWEYKATDKDDGRTEINRDLKELIQRVKERDEK